MTQVTNNGSGSEILNDVATTAGIERSGPSCGREERVTWVKGLLNGDGFIDVEEGANAKSRGNR